MTSKERRTVAKGRRKEDQKIVSDSSLLSAAIDAVADPFIVVGTDFRVKLINKAAKNFCNNADIENNIFCYQLIFGLDNPCAHQGRPCPLTEVLESDGPVKLEYEQRSADGKSVFYEIIASPLYNDAGEFLGIVESLRDITQRRHLANILQTGREELEISVLERTAELKQAKEQADILFRVIPSATFTVDTARTITSWNDNAQEVTGYTPEEVLGNKCAIFALNPCTEGCGVFSKNVEKPIIGRECLIRTKDGRTRIVSKNADLLTNPNGLVIGAVESFEDITERKEVERQLRTERDKFMSMLSALNQGMHILTRDYDIEYQNDVLISDFGDQIGQKCYQVYKQLDEPCEICRMREAIENNTVLHTELLMANGRFYAQSYAPFTDIDGDMKALILLRDITDEKAKQAESMRAAQLASIGELAAGVAHEINNPINGIINYAQLLLDNIPAPLRESDEDPGRHILTNVIREGERIAAIVSNLLSFARQGEEAFENIDLAEVISDSIALVNHQLQNDGIIIALDIPRNLPQVHANRQQLQQVFLNLLSNARYALNQRYTTKDSFKKIKIQSMTTIINNSPYVRTILTDWGTGIPVDILNHIFKPFFTMKEAGQGTGLGLSISSKLIDNCKGFLKVESEVNNFTRMLIDLPAGSAADISA